MEIITTTKMETTAQYCCFRTDGKKNTHTQKQMLSNRIDDNNKHQVEWSENGTTSIVRQRKLEEQKRRHQL